VPLRAAVDNVCSVVLGKRREVELALAAVLAEGHILIEDVPGVGKTLLAKALAHTFGGTFKRIQFTPDLLPSDVTGVSVFNQRSGAFEFRAGPIAAHVVLADEINRSPSSSARRRTTTRATPSTRSVRSSPSTSFARCRRRYGGYASTR
jgi:MoxR-like ATPase